MKNEQNMPPMEDYGSPATDKDKTSTSGSQSSSNQSGGKTSGQVAGEYAGGTTGTEQGSSEGEQFGEFDYTATGTDLTITMDNTDPRTGLVKGGETGEADTAGPGQYGGKAGGLPETF